MRKAYDFRLILDDTWIDMLRDRNDLTYDYDGEIVKSVCVKLINSYLDFFEIFQKTVKTQYFDTIKK